MNKVSKHRKKDGNQARNDWMDGALEVRQLNHITFLPTNATRKIVFESEPKAPEHIKLERARLCQYDDKHDGNIYCMTAINDEWLKNNNILDKRMTGFGGEKLSVVVIHNIPVFLMRIKSKLDEMRLGADWGLVKYYDPSQQHEQLSPFHKSSEYSYQNEFRIYVHRFEAGELIINIGPLQDIAEHIIINDLDNFNIYLDV
ncbi:MAG: hypothetical protein SFV22_09820, partial [Saprospiraceae bacterium]|nr:hypothetical protein [Saprospiraceae bacterium]